MFDKEDAKVIIQLCDLALKAQGLQAVNTVLPLVKKCEQLLAAEPAKEPAE